MVTFLCIFSNSRGKETAILLSAQVVCIVLFGLFVDYDSSIAPMETTNQTQSASAKASTDLNRLYPSKYIFQGDQIKSNERSMAKSFDKRPLVFLMKKLKIYSLCMGFLKFNVWGFLKIKIQFARHNVYQVTRELTSYVYGTDRRAVVSSNGMKRIKFGQNGSDF